MDFLASSGRRDATLGGMPKFFTPNSNICSSSSSRVMMMMMMMDNI